MRQRQPQTKLGEAPQVRPLSDAMRDRLYELGQQQLEAAKEIGVPKQAFNDWLHGKRSPMAQHAPKLAKWLGVSTSTLIDMIAMRLSPTEMLARLNEIATLAETQAAKITALESRLTALDKRVKQLEPKAKRGDGKGASRT